MCRYVGQSSDLAASCPFVYGAACTTNMSGYDFRKGQPLPHRSSLLRDSNRHSGERDCLSCLTFMLNIDYTRAAERKSIADKNSSRVCF
jgi:hypothetical protein